MSLLDQLRALEDQVSKRITELRPAVVEFEELRKVADRLGGLSDRLGLSHRDAATSERATSSDAAPAADPTTTETAASRSAEEGKTPGTRSRPRAANTSATKKRVGSAVSPSTPGRRRSAKAPATAGSSESRSTTTAGTAGRTGRGGARQQEILEAVRASPGVSVAELAQQLDVAATNLYRPIKRLQERGELTKAGTRLTVAEKTGSGT